MLGHGGFGDCGLRQGGQTVQQIVQVAWIIGIGVIAGGAQQHELAFQAEGGQKAKGIHAGIGAGVYIVIYIVNREGAGAFQRQAPQAKHMYHNTGGYQYALPKNLAAVHIEPLEAQQHAGDSQRDRQDQQHTNIFFDTGECLLKESGDGIAAGLDQVDGNKAAEDLEVNQLCRVPQEQHRQNQP